MEIINKLRGGDLRSIGRVEEVVTDILADNALFDVVFEGMCSSHPVVRMRSLIRLLNCYVVGLNAVKVK